MPASIPLQPAGVPFQDPTFDTTITRFTAATDAGSYATHIYSQLQAFSADNEHVLVVEDDSYVVRRVSDRSFVAGLVTWTWNAPRWQPALPHTLVHYDDNGDSDVTVQYTNVDTLVTTDHFTFPAAYVRIRGNQSFDELSHDGRWMAGMAARNDGVQVVFSLDLSTRTFGAVLPLSDLYSGPCDPDPTWGEVEPDWVGVSPLGNYLVVQWARDGETRCSGLETFNITTGAFTGRVAQGHTHGDLGHAADGTEFFMTTELSSPADTNRPALSYRTLPGTATASDPVYLRVMDWSDGDHISCQGPPGVCLVSWGGWADGEWRPFEDELFLQYTDGSVLRLTQHRSSSCGYWVQPRGSLSRDGSLVIFASDWGKQTGTDSCGGNELGLGEAYMINVGGGRVCGNGTVESGETCDDGNTTSGDGCDSNCTPTACGNDIVTAGEQCDDGNTTNDDCCSATCQADAAGSLCGDENVCNGLETCNGSGMCTAGTPLVCEDGDLCTFDACDPSAGCIATGGPAPDCANSTRASLKIDTPRGKLVWNWVRNSGEDFADPTADADHALCIWDMSSGTPVRSMTLGIDAGAGWESVGTRGFNFGAGNDDGVASIRIRSGTARSRITLKAAGDNLNLAPPVSAVQYFAQDPAVLVQFVNSEGSCWASELETAGRNEADRFQATMP